MEEQNQNEVPWYYSSMEEDQGPVKTSLPFMASRFDIGDECNGWVVSLGSESIVFYEEDLEQQEEDVN